MNLKELIEIVQYKFKIIEGELNNPDDEDLQDVDLLGESEDYKNGFKDGLEWVLDKNPKYKWK